VPCFGAALTIGILRRFRRLSAFHGLGPGSASRAVFAGAARPQPGLDYAITARPPAFDAVRHKERNTVERCVSKLKQFRAVATFYDKREPIHHGTFDEASIRIGLSGPDRPGPEE
jgi:transposase